MRLESRIVALLEPTIVELGFELWGVELLSPNHRPTLRLYIENVAGVTVDDCAVVSRHVSGLLELENAITGEYILEVSSPGIDRLLFKREHYEAYAGEPVEVRLQSPFEGRRRFRGWLRHVEGDDLVVEVDQFEYWLPIGSIEKARVQPRLDGLQYSKPSPAQYPNKSGVGREMREKS